jgi:hypothetical protein
MSELTAGFEDDDVIADRLRAALLGKDDRFCDKLYGVDTIPQKKRRDLVQINKEESEKLIAELRKKISVRSCEIVRKARHQGDLAILFRINEDVYVEVVVDDLYPYEDRWLARDLLKFSLAPPEDPSNDRRA